MQTSIGNNSGSIEDRAVKFACSMEFSAMADQMAWLPSLSRDRKYIHSLRSALAEKAIFYLG